jgi:uncharacterized coiled-coil protein SlyX
MNTCVQPERVKSVEDRLTALENSIKCITEIIEELRTDLTDHKEAFEHTDDSLQNLRISVSAMKSNT